MRPCRRLHPGPNSVDETPATHYVGLTFDMVITTAWHIHSLRITTKVLEQCCIWLARRRWWQYYNRSSRKYPWNSDIVSPRSGFTYIPWKVQSTEDLPTGHSRLCAWICALKSTYWTWTSPSLSSLLSAVTASRWTCSINWCRSRVWSS